MADHGDARRNLPGVDRLLDHPELRVFRSLIATPHLTKIVRAELDRARAAVSQGKTVPSEDMLARRIAAIVDGHLTAGPRRVINATGTILHTGLGRAPLSPSAISALHESAGYCDLEFDLATGDRGDRQGHVENLLAWLTGSEAALVVNNNAAALFLVLHALASRKEVIVSRGQLIEIGGSFRLPEIMSRAGAKLVEVGTTNRTRVADFSTAVTPNTAMLLRAYPSNFRIEGFSESVEIAELAAVARQHGILCVDDLGGGLLWDWADIGMPAEPHVSQSLTDGADLVLVSGDKVMGGPQSGIILGRTSLVTKLKKSPLARVLRPGKLEIAALAATLLSFLHPDRAARELPVWRMFAETPQVTRARAEKLILLLKSCEWSLLEVRESPAQAGSGTLPATPLPSFAVAIRHVKLSSARFAKALRQGALPVIGTIQEDIVLLNLRTVADEEVGELANVILSLAGDKA